MKPAAPQTWPDERSLGIFLVVIFFFLTALMTISTDRQSPAPEPTAIPTQATSEPTTQPTQNPTPIPTTQAWLTTQVSGYSTTLAYSNTWGEPVSREVRYDVSSPESVFDHTEVTFTAGPTIRLSKLASYQSDERRTEQLDASVAGLKQAFSERRYTHSAPVFLPPFTSIGQFSKPEYIESKGGSLRGVYFFAEQPGSVTTAMAPLTLFVATLLSEDNTVVQLSYSIVNPEGGSSTLTCSNGATCQIPQSLLDLAESDLTEAILRLE